MIIYRIRKNEGKVQSNSVYIKGPDCVAGRGGTQGQGARTGVCAARQQPIPPPGSSLAYCTRPRKRPGKERGLIYDFA